MLQFRSAAVDCCASGIACRATGRVPGGGGTSFKPVHKGDCALLTADRTTAAQHSHHARSSWHAFGAG